MWALSLRSAVLRERAVHALAICHIGRVLQSSWPDLIVRIALACLFLHSAVGVSVDALRELRGGVIRTA
jgi:Co/Zn/Cd efflux system component